MNIKILSVVGLWLLITSSLLNADNMSSKDYADKFYAEWNAPRERGDDSAGFMVAQFYHEVPPSLRGEVLDQIFDRAFSATPKKAYQPMGFVMMCLMNFGSELNLPPRLDTELNALTKDSNWMARRDVLRVIRTLGRTTDEDLIVAALSDPKDEVRGAAINALRDRPDAEARYQKFIRDHQSDPTYATSVQYAKGGLESIHEKAHTQ